MPTESLIETIKRELPGQLREDPELRRYIIALTRDLYADRARTEDRFDRILDELQRDREAQIRKWEEHRREQDLTREEQNHKREEQNRKWDENRREQNLKWEESGKEFAAIHEKIMTQARKFDRSIGALGSRWGLQSEAAFRNALAGILEERFGVTVRNVSELDIIVKNGLLLILELKSWISKADVYVFERKTRFYTRRHQRPADRLIVVFPRSSPRHWPSHGTSASRSTATLAMSPPSSEELYAPSAPVSGRLADNHVADCTGVSLAFSQRRLARGWAM